jgi:hypothetical protein
MPQAKNICHGCPVVNECLKDGLDKRDRWAILGGLTPHERDLMLRNATRAAKRDAS